MIKVIIVVVISCGTTSASPVLISHHLQALHINANRERRVPVSLRSSCIHYSAAPHRMIGGGSQPIDDHYTTSGQGPDARAASGNNIASVTHHREMGEKREIYGAGKKEQEESYLGSQQELYTSGIKTILFGKGGGGALFQQIFTIYET